MEKLTRQEEEIMCQIWELERCYIKDILARLDDPKPPYTTLASIVKNLERKKYVKISTFGNVYEYEALVDKKDYKRSYMNNVVNSFFASSYKDMVSFFAEEEKISPEDLKEILSLIENSKK